MNSSFCPGCLVLLITQHNPTFCCTKAMYKHQRWAYLLLVLAASQLAHVWCWVSKTLSEITWKDFEVPVS